MYYKFEEFIEYFLFGLVTSLISILSFYVLNEMIGWHYLIANVVAVTLSILFSYTVNKRYVFKTHTKTRKAFVKEFVLFVLFRSTGATLDMLGLFVLVSFFSLNPTLSKIGVGTVIASSNYFVSRKLIFKNIK
ncbi:GtrA family protein [Alkalibacterium sp. 20]|uniref:GtrA family protein n=1 Tax=Alkalibacterium sp. 20 TaxID=1798803 RepID=UPI00090047E3|nr:GtrA family protein [Alkalibacterium sp. 20]